MKKQEIENKHKQDLIEFIKPFNTRWSLTALKYFACIILSLK
jgi:hypothetical protein